MPPSEPEPRPGRMAAFAADRRHPRPPTPPTVLSEAAPEPELLQVRLPGGGTLLVAVSRSQPGTGYAIERSPSSSPAGGWRCACPGYRWRGHCRHLKAAAAAGWLRPPPMTQEKGEP